MPVHCYGHPCDVDAIEKIANTYGLKVIYDAAHAFGVECHCGSVLNHGDLSVLSFHATKVFNTFEGGAIVCPDEKTKVRIDQLKNFGHAGEINVVAPGINGKMSEINAAFGLVQLRHMGDILAKRGAIDARYRKNLKSVPGILCLEGSGEKVANYAYFPILVKPEYPLDRERLNEVLKENGVIPRRYFYPLISEFSMYQGLLSSMPSNLPQATQATKQVLCLPIYPGLHLEIVDEICSLIAAQ
jgi:dTDP-4-amino-4,6-dideoxygalactose transaminase